MKTAQCEQCFFNDYETFGCLGTQLRWAFENLCCSLCSSIPVIRHWCEDEPTPCVWFEPKDGDQQ